MCKTTDVICTRDSATSRAAPRTESHSALDLTPTRLVSCAHRGVLEVLLAKIAQVDTRATARDAHEYNSSRTQLTRDLIINLPTSLLYRRRISRLVSRDRSSPMSALLDPFVAAEIFALASVDAIPVEDARNHLQSHITVDVMIEGLDQLFTDSITSEGCATPAVKNFAAPPSEFEVQTRAPTARLPPELLPLPVSASPSAPLPPHVQLAYPFPRLREQPRSLCICNDDRRTYRSRDGGWSAFRFAGVAYLVR